MRTHPTDAITSDQTVHQREPLNTEPPTRRLADAFITPMEDFFVRCHGEAPSVDEAAYRLRVVGTPRALSLSLSDLVQEFAARTVPASLQCAGNRRAELDAVKSIDGVPWGPGAIGTARWTGASLGDVLRAAGVTEATEGHVAFTGLDTADVDGETTSFGGSIPLHKALSEEVVLAWAMNGAPLAAAHGAPLRVVVPGYIGARSVKWLAEIRVQPEPSDNYFQRDYQLRPSSGPLGELPLTSAICTPAAWDVVVAGPVAVRGYAMVGGGQPIDRVEISADDGQTWTPARLETGGPWTWTLWQAEVTLPPGRHVLVVRAHAGGRVQPERVDAVWNPKGYLNNAWHRVEIVAR